MLQREPSIAGFLCFIEVRRGVTKVGENKQEKRSECLGGACRIMLRQNPPENLAEDDLGGSANHRIAPFPKSRRGKKKKEIF